jgi:CheY-like chemotaxis protein
VKEWTKEGAIMNDGAHSVLLVEDNPGDVLLMHEALHEVGVAAEVEVIDDGAKALARLLDARLPCPELVILNVNLPKVPGYELLDAIKRSDRLRSVPVLMLTTSDAQRDRLRCRRADAFFVKGGDWDDTLSVARHMNEYLTASPSKRIITMRHWAEDQACRAGSPSASNRRPRPSSRRTRSR